MNKIHLLRVAGEIRKDRLKGFADTNAARTFIPDQAVHARFSDLAKGLSDAERKQLLQALAAALERERRACKGRKFNYDPGRHISLYIATKALRPESKKPPK
jgi:hypothetical protein